MNETTENGTTNGTESKPKDVGLEAAAAAVGLKDATVGFETIRGMLSAIVIADRYEIEDLLGNPYSFRPVLSARRQITASVLIDSFVRRSVDTEALDGAQEAKAAGGLMAGLMAFLKHVIQDEAVQEDLQQIFLAIHPEILKSATKSATDGPDGPLMHVMDLFELHVILEALVPFFARSATKIAGVLAGMTEADSGASSLPSPTLPSAN